MRRLRTLTELECYTRCYGGWERTVTIRRLEPRWPRYELPVTGEALRAHFEQLLDTRDPEQAIETEAA